MAKKSVHILLMLLNGTSCMAEMDQLFEKFKPACSKSTLCVASKKMQARINARILSKSKGNGDVADDEIKYMEEEEDADKEEEEIGEKMTEHLQRKFLDFDLGILLMAGRKTRWSGAHLISISRISQQRESSTPGRQLTGFHPSWSTFLRYCNISKKLGF
jgi:hypothetical protein